MAKTIRTQATPRGAASAGVRRYEHKLETVARPEIGAAPRFNGKAALATYRCNSSLAPSLDWD
jgi:hypothetical protein